MYEFILFECFVMCGILWRIYLCFLLIIFVDCFIGIFFFFWGGYEWDWEAEMIDK